MINRSTAARLIGKPAGVRFTVAEGGTNADIVHAVLAMDEQACKEVAPLAGKFTGKNVRETAQNIWSFIRMNVRYDADDVSNQQIKSPKALLASGVGDCKSFSILARALMNCHGFTFTGYRFAGYNGQKYPSHVYTYFGNSTLDATIPRFDSEPSYSLKKDFPMSKINVYSISGIGSEPVSVPVADLYKEAETVLMSDSTLGARGPRRWSLPKTLARLDEIASGAGQTKGRTETFTAYNARMAREKAYVINATYAIRNVWENPDNIKALIIGYNNDLYLNKLGFVVYQGAPPKFIEYAEMYRAWIRTMSALGYTKYEADLFLVYAAANKTTLSDIGTGQTAISGVVVATILLVLAAIAKAAAAITGLALLVKEGIQIFKDDLKEQGVDVDWLTKNVPAYWDKAKQLWTKDDTGGGGGSGGGGDTGGGGGGGAATEAGINPLFLGLGAFALFSMFK